MPLRSEELMKLALKGLDACAEREKFINSARNDYLKCVNEAIHLKRYDLYRSQRRLNLLLMATSLVPSV